jgi:hypothetical protein
VDDSGTSGLPLVTLGGLIAHIDQWEHIEPSLHEICGYYDVPVLHAVDFQHTRGAFRAWKKIKKQTFVEELFGANKGRMAAFSISIRAKAYVTEKKAQGVLPSMSAACVCFSALMLRVLQHPSLGPAIHKDGVNFLVETGNANNAEIEKFFHQYTKIDPFSRVLRSISFIPKQHCRAIQAADFYVYYARRQAVAHDKFSGRLALPANSYLEAIERHIPTFHKTATGGLSAVGKASDLAPDFKVPNSWRAPKA